MKKFLKSTLAIFLMLLMVVFMIPFSAVAESEESAAVETESEATFSCETGLDLIVSNLTEGEENPDYVITSLEFEDKTAYVELSNIAECNLIVAVYDEETMQMYASGITEVSIEHMTVSVEIDIETMPDYYIAKAYLVDDEYAPLCSSYESYMNTTKYEEFTEKTPDDFSEEVIIFDDTKEQIDFGVLNEGVVTSVLSTEMTFTYNEETLTYTFCNAIDEVKNLEVGDIYYYEYGNLSNEFLLFKVKSISASGSTVEIIQDEDISLSETFSFIRIDAEGNYDNLEIDRSRLGEALTSIETIDEKVSNNGGDSPEFDVDTGEKSWGMEFGVEWKINDNASVKGSLGYKLTTSAKLIYDAVLFGKDYYEFKFEIKHKFSLIGFEVKGEISVPKDKIRIPVPPIPVGPLTLNINIAPIVEFSGSVSFDVDYIIKMVVTADNDNGMQKTENVSTEWDPELDAGIEIKLGVSIEFELTLSKIISLSLTGEGGVKFEADVAMVGVWLDKHHDCLTCVEGETNAFVNISLTLKIKIIPKVVDFSWDAIKWSKQWYLFDFYVSVGLSGFSTGKGECPNISHAVTFNVYIEENGTQVKLEGAKITAPTGICDANSDGKFAETEMLTNSDGQAVFYFKSGEHTASIYYDGYDIKTESFSIISNEKIIDVYLSGDSSGNSGSTSNPLTGTESVGDIIEFGSYPQSEVTDSSLKAALDSISKTWISYGYYTGTGSTSDGKMQPSDYMKYADVTYNGVKYRAVTFSQYRPYYTGYTSSSGNTYQDDNGYNTNTTYYFKYEPLEWRVLDPEEGLVMCESIIDSQAYNNTIYYNSTIANSKGSGYAYFQDSTCTTYANDYAASSIRDWLNDDFYNTAFTSSEKSEIGTTTLDNSCYSSSYPELDSATTNDKIFLLSYNEAINSAYGFSSDGTDYDTARRAQGTDYAKCQGLWVSKSSSYYGNSEWRLRSPDYYSNIACEVFIVGYVDDYNSVCYTYSGIRPALKFNPESVISESTSQQAYSNGAAASNTATLFDISKDACVAGHDYLLLNVSDYSADFVLTSENLLFVNQLTADSNGNVNTSFVPKTVDENSTTLLIGDFGNGVETKEIVPENSGEITSSLRLLNSTEFREGNNITIFADYDVDRVAIYSTTFDGETVTVETENTPITISSSKAFVVKYSDWHKAGNSVSTTLTIGETEYNVKFVFRLNGDGHIYSSVVTPPTANSQGYTTHTCSCGESYTDSYVEPSGFTVKGTIGVSGNFSGEITLEFIKSGETDVSDLFTVSGDSEEYLIEGIEAGGYTLKVSKENHATREYNIIIGEEDIQIDVQLNLLGDITGDGKVNTLDVARANAQAKGISSLSDYEKSCADINGDGKVNTLDVARMNAHAKGVSLLW